MAKPFRSRNHLLFYYQNKVSDVWGNGLCDEFLGIFSHSFEILKSRPFFSKPSLLFKKNRLDFRKYRLIFLRLFGGFFFVILVTVLYKVPLFCIEKDNSGI